MSFAPLETERLSLRPLELTDAEAVRQLAGDPRIASTTLNIPHPYPEGVAEIWIALAQEQMVQGGAYPLAVIQKADGRLVGTMSFSNVNQTHRRAELAYWIGVEWWGRGYATEAARRLLQFGFGELGLNRIYAAHMTRNPASGRVMVKLGMRLEGVLRDHITKDGQFEDLAYYGILRSEFCQ